LIRDQLTTWEVASSMSGFSSVTPQIECPFNFHSNECSTRRKWKQEIARRNRKHENLRHENRKTKLEMPRHEFGVAENFPKQKHHPN
jgi:hypothetical protein